MRILKSIFLATFIFLLLGFVKNEKNEIHPVSNSSFNASGAYLSSDNNQDVILNWTEEIDQFNTSVLKFKIFDKKKQAFGKEIVVTSSKGLQSHHESMPKVAKTGSGLLYAVFRFTTPNSKRRFAGSIYYSISEDNGNTWTNKIKLVDDEQAQSQSFYDLDLLSNGELGLTWLDSRKLDKEKNGSTLYFATTNKNKGFVNQKPIASYTCQCCRTDLFVDSNSNIHIAFRNIENESIRDMYQVVSTNNGQSFSQPERMGEDNWKIDGCPHTGPSLGSSKNEVAVTWFTGAKSGVGIFYEKLSDEISLVNNKLLISETGRHPQMVMTGYGNAYIVYEDFITNENTSYASVIFHAVYDDGSTSKKELSLPKTKNDHAVISKLNESQVLVAWTSIANDQSKVVYRIIDL